MTNLKQSPLLQETPMSYPFFPFFLPSEEGGDGERLLFLEGVDFGSCNKGLEADGEKLKTE